MFKLVVFLLIARMKAVESMRCTFRSDYWVHNTTVLDMEYYVSKNIMSFPECASHCSQLGNCAHLAEDIIPIVTSEFKNNICLTNSSLWIQHINSRNKCYVLSNRRFDTAPCESKFPCLCERRASKTMKHVNGYEFCIDYTHRANQMSVMYCKYMWNSSLVGYSNPLQYVKLSDGIALKIGSYWIKSGSVGFGRKCLVLKVDGKESYIHEADCKERFYSICTRLTNVSEILANPDFVQLLRNMTVPKQETSYTRSKRISADDHRTVAKVIGLSSVVIIVLVIGLFVVADLVKSVEICRQRRCCKKHKCNSKVQPAS